MPRSKLGKRFRPLRELEGAAQVRTLEAVDLSSQRRLGLHVLPWSSSTEGAIARFKQEFRTLSELKHPNIIRAQDFELIVGDCCFFTTEPWAGRTLQDYFQPCDFERLARVTVEICETLDFLHSRGIVLGRFTPSSVVVEERPDRPNGFQIQLLQLGFELPFHPSANELPDWLHYAAPETLMSRASDRRANLYSLGVVLYELITGFRPYDADSPVELMKQHLKLAPTPPRQLRPDLPPDLEAIVLRLLEKRPSRRFQTAHEVMEAIERRQGRSSARPPRSMRERGIFSSELIGRQKEFAKLQGAYRAFKQGRGGVVPLTGEAGVGKTRLLEEFRLFLQLEGETVLHARCIERARAPFQEIQELFGQLRPRLENQEKPFSSPLHGHWAETFLEYATILPHAMILDDLQLASEETIEFLRELLPRLHQRPILLVLIFERLEPDSGHPLLELLGSIAQEPIELEPFSREETAQFLESLLGPLPRAPDLARRLHQRTGGNPFLVEVSLEILIRQGALDEANEGAWELFDLPGRESPRLPGNILEGVSGKLSSLPRPQLGLLELIAVFGQATPFWLLLELTTLEQDSLQAILFTLQTQQLLEAQPGPERESAYRLAQAKLGEVLYQRMEPKRRQTLHARIARCLIRQAPSEPRELASPIAHHCFEGRLRRLSIEWSLKAARSALGRLAFRSARRELDRCLAQLEQPGRGRHAAERMEALELAGDLELHRGEPRAARSRYQQCLEAGPGPPHPPRLRRKLARTQLVEGEFARARELLEQSLRATELTGGHPEKLWLLLELTGVQVAEGQILRADESLRRAEALLDERTPAEQKAELLYLRAACFIERGQGQSALGALRECLGICERLHDPLGIARAFGALGLAHESLGQGETSIEFLEKALRIFESLGHRPGLAQLQILLGGALFRLTSDWGRALALLEQGASLSQALGNQAQAGGAEIGRALVLLDRGLAAESWKLLCLVEQEQQANAVPRFRSALRQAIGYWSLRNGQGPEAVEKLSEAIEEARIHGLLRTAAQIQLLLAEAMLVSGRIEEGLRWVEQLQPELELGGNLRELSAALRLRGLGELLRVRPETALELLRQAEKLARELGSEPELGKIQLAYALLASQTQDRRAEVDALRRAEHLFKRSGAMGLLADVERRVVLLQEETSARLRRADDKSQEFSQLYRITQLLSPILDTEVLLRRMLELTAESVGADRGLLLLGGEAEETSLASHGYGEDELEVYSKSIVQKVLREGAPLLSTEAAKDPRFHSTLSIEVLEVRSVICVPLRLESGSAALYLANLSQSKIFSERDLDFVSAIAGQAAIAFKNAVLHERYRAILDESEEGALVVDRLGIIRDFSRAAEQILGIPESEILGLSIEEGLHAKIQADLGSILTETLSRGKGLRRELKFHRGEDPRVRWIEATTSLLRDGYGEPVGATAVFQEITDVKRLQAELELQRRLSAMGQLAAQVAHKMKNLLSGIKLLAQGLRRECAEGDEETGLVQEILSTVASAESTVYEQLGSSATGAEEEVASLSLVLRELAEQAREKLLEKKLALEPRILDTPPLKMKRKQVADAFRGVLQNAVDASREGGRIRLDCAFDENPTTTPGAQGSIQIEIQDWGRGIEPEHLGKVFDPFFTTRPGATGIGLWLFHKAIESLKGRIQIQSEPGQGTLLRCIVPVPAQERWEQWLES